MNWMNGTLIRSVRSIGERGRFLYHQRRSRKSLPAPPLSTPGTWKCSAGRNRNFRPPCFHSILFLFFFFNFGPVFCFVLFFFVAVGPRSFRSIQRTVAAVWNGSRAPYISKMQKKQNKKRRRSSSYWDFVLDFTFCWPARRHLRKSDPQREGRYPTTVPKRGGRTKRGSMVLPSIMTMILRPPPFVSLFVFFCTSTGCSLNG